MHPVRCRSLASLAIAACLIAGCTTPPPPPPATASKSAPTAAPSTVEKAKSAPVAEKKVEAPAPAAEPIPTPEAEPEAPAKISPEAAALVERLTESVDADTLRHELSDTTGFPQAMQSLEHGAHAPKLQAVDMENQPPPAGLTADGTNTRLVERDWTGLVLVPIETSLAKAYTSEVRLLKVEAHPLNDGRVRIWTRIHNIGKRTLPGQIACSFRMKGQPLPTSPYFYQLDVPPHSHRDVFFVSPDGDLSSYTVLVRSEEMKHNK